MKNIYQRITNCQGTDQLKKELQTLGFLEMFEPIFMQYPEHIHEQAVQYIVNAYCKDSPHLYVGGTTWSMIKENCAKMAGLPEEYWENFVYFGGEHIEATPTVDDEEKEKLTEKEETSIEKGIIDDRINSIIDAIDSFIKVQGSRDHRHLMSMYDLYEELISASTARIKTDRSSNIDYKTKRECMNQATELLEEIKEFEKKVADQDLGLEAAKEELVKKKSAKRSFRPEVAANKNN